MRYVVTCATCPPVRSDFPDRAAAEAYADRLRALDRRHQPIITPEFSINASEDGDEPLGESPEIGTRFEPVHAVTYYQARCTKCGTTEEDYGQYSALHDPDYVIRFVCENYEWFERTRDEVVSENPRRITVHTEELLCPQCQRCEVCGGDRAYPIDDNHTVCADHEDHEFEVSA